MKEDTYITAKELRDADYFMLGMEQQRIFGKQFVAISKNAEKKLKNQLDPRKENEILRCVGQYKNFFISVETK